MDVPSPTIFYVDLNTEDKLVIKTLSVPLPSLEDGYEFGSRYIPPWEMFPDHSSAETLAISLAENIGVEYDKR